MKRKKLFKVFIGIVILTLVIVFLTPVIVGPLIKNKIQTTLNEKYKDYVVEIGQLHFYLFSASFELEKITIT